MDNNEHHLVHQNLLQEVLEAGSTPCCSGGEPPSQDRETKHYHRPDGILLNDMGEGSHQNLLNQLQKDVPHHEQVSHQVPQHLPPHTARRQPEHDVETAGWKGWQLRTTVQDSHQFNLDNTSGIVVQCL